jgi:hypothetical protein
MLKPKITCDLLSVQTRGIVVRGRSPSAQVALEAYALRAPKFAYGETLQIERVEVVEGGILSITLSLDKLATEVEREPLQSPQSNPSE